MHLIPQKESRTAWSCISTFVSHSNHNVDGTTSCQRLEHITITQIIAQMPRADHSKIGARWRIDWVCGDVAISLLWNSRSKMLTRLAEMKEEGFIVSSPRRLRCGFDTCHKINRNWLSHYEHGRLSRHFFYDETIWKINLYSRMASRKCHFVSYSIRLDAELNLLVCETMIQAIRGPHSASPVLMPFESTKERPC